MSEMVLKTPASVAELTAALKDADKDTYLISGGTDLIIKMRNNKIYSGTIIDLKGIHELEYIKEDEGSIKIGANTTFTRIIENPAVQKYVACLVQAVSQIGSTQIRNAATIGGNVANAFTGADSIPALITIGARVKVINSNGETNVKGVEEIVVGSGKNSLKSDEAIIEIEIPILDNGCKTAFGKIGSRSRVTIAKLNMAAVVKIDQQEQKIEDARIVLGALGPKAFRSEITEKALIGQEITRGLAIQFANTLTDQVDAAIAGRGSQAYKREAIRGLADEVFQKLFGPQQEVK
ncbi:MAG: FAD binding domain-containing protein [Bacillota bacterium]